MRASDLLPSLGLLLLLPLDCCSSPGPGIAGSLMLKLFIRLERLRSRPWLLFLAGDALLGERCSPAFIAAAACSEDNEGDLGDGGLGRKESGVEIDMRLGRAVGAGGDVGSEFRSGIADAKETTEKVEARRLYDLLYVGVAATKDGRRQGLCFANHASLCLSGELQAAVDRAAKLVTLFATSRRLANDDSKLFDGCNKNWTTLENQHRLPKVRLSLKSRLGRGVNDRSPLNWLVHPIPEYRGCQMHWWGHHLSLSTRPSKMRTKGSSSPFGGFLDPEAGTFERPRIHQNQRQKTPNA